MEDRETVEFGPFKVTCYPVDYENLGASGYADGIWYTPGIFASRRTAESIAFAEVHASWALVVEGTMLSEGLFLRNGNRRRVSILQTTPGFVLLMIFPKCLRKSPVMPIACSYGRSGMQNFYTIWDWT